MAYATIELIQTKVDRYNGTGSALRMTCGKSVMRCLWGILGAALVCTVWGLPATPRNTDALPSYNASLVQTSVSGLSSGGFFAVQMHVAFSSIIVGAGVFAGGPYDCAQGSMTTALTTCMNPLMIKPSPEKLEKITESRAQDGVIDPVSYLSNSSVFLFSGAMDMTVHRPVMDALNEYYKHFLPEASVMYETSIQAAHTQPTDDPANKNACSLSASPYLSNCNYDGAGMALKKIFPFLKPRNEGDLSGTIITFSQDEFFTSSPTSMDSTGYAYVPASCASGANCTVHISFHGCEQYAGTVGTAYVEHSGYNRWADTNNMIVLYPQTTKSELAPMNPNGCWDWWGYLDNNYDEQAGTQMAGVRKMMDRLAGRT